ncbi:MAG TPA: L,D-transpeptidase [Polyangiaceae bacterium]|nr:L,D-transpeptidase [Polyangiaceae bacterium]
MSPSARRLAAARGARPARAGIFGLFLSAAAFSCDPAEAERTARAAPLRTEAPQPIAPKPAEAVAPKAPPVRPAPPRAEELGTTQASSFNPAADSDSSATTLDTPARVYAKTRFVWVWPEPDASKSWIGFLWTGSSVRLRDTTPRSGPGCATFYAVEPQGYVCVDGKRATLDESDPVYRAVRPYALKSDSAYPHRYAESRGTPRYFSEPTPEQQRLRENDLTSHLRGLTAARAGEISAAFSGVDLSLPEQGPVLFPALPNPIFEDRRQLKARSTVAYSTEARFGDRAFLLSADYTWIPKDRVVPYPTVAFQGLALGTEHTLPLAFFRGKDRPQYTRASDGTFTASGKAFARLSHVALTGVRERFDDQTYWQTRETSVWVRQSEAVIPQPRATTPWGAPLGQQDVSGRTPKGRATWIEISIEGGWLVAFEGTRPVYVTLMSPGRGGAAKPDEDPLERSATPTGNYPISGKFVTATMVAPGELVHSDVPFAQNIVGPYALHGAYWHDNWGRPQSGGCVNLAPLDAKWMFDFTEPALPEGWHGVRWLPWQGPATKVILHR